MGCWLNKDKKMLVEKLDKTKIRVCEHNHDNAVSCTWKYYAECEYQGAARVSIHGMYDCHLFHEITGSSIDEVISNWVKHISKTIPAIFAGGQKVSDLGPSCLCPAIVLDEHGKELRRVGKMVFPDYSTRTPDPTSLAKYREALLSDPDIANLLSSN